MKYERGKTWILDFEALKIRNLFINVQKSKIQI